MAKERIERRRTRGAKCGKGGPLLLAVLAVVSGAAVAAEPETEAVYNQATHSSPIALSLDQRLVWVVNPGDDSVSVLRTDNNMVLTTIKVGDEPQSVALDPNNRFAVVANAAGSSLSVIAILNAKYGGFKAAVLGALKTGAEPWNVVVSPDGKRVFVANSGQDTITVIDARRGTVIGHVDLRHSLCNDPDRERHFQPRGLAVSADNLRLYATRFLSFTRPSGGHGLDDGEEGAVCRLNIDTSAAHIGGDETDGDGSVNKINLHLGARDPEPGKTKLFFANPWAIAFTTPAGVGNAYAVSAGSDLLIKLNVAADGSLSNTVDADTTRYIDLNDPAEPATSGDNAGKNPQGIAITANGARAYVANVISGNVSVVDLHQDKVVDVVRTVDLPPPGSLAEEVAVGAEMFFSSRGHFDRPAHATVSTDNRLSSEGWQNCASCHFEGLTDGVVWSFGPGPRKSIPMSGSFNPRDRDEQRILNYSAQRDETQDFTLNARNVSGPGPLPAPIPCSAPPPDVSTFDPDQGLLVGDADFNQPPCVINDFVKPNSGRSQVTVTLPGSGTQVAALDALNTWLKFAVRVPNGPLNSLELRGGVPIADIVQGAILFKQQQCTECHSGGLWTVSVKDFAPPPALAEIFCERNVANPALPSCATDPVVGNPNAGQYLDEFLREVGSYNRGVAGQGNELGANIGAVEKSAAAVVGGVAQAQQEGLGIDFNDDDAGEGFAVSSLLGIHAAPPYGHNGSCETVACVVADEKHRTANGSMPDLLTDPGRQAKVARFVELIDARTRPFRR